MLDTGGWASLPPSDRHPPLARYFGIKVILSFIGWTGLARVVREQDFVMAAKLAGASEGRVCGLHRVGV